MGKLHLSPEHCHVKLLDAERLSLCLCRHILKMSRLWWSLCAAMSSAAEESLQVRSIKRSSGNSKGQVRLCTHKFLNDTASQTTLRDTLTWFTKEVIDINRLLLLLCSHLQTHSLFTDSAHVFLSFKPIHQWISEASQCTINKKKCFKQVFRGLGEGGSDWFIDLSIVQNHLVKCERLENRNIFTVQ